MKNLVQRIKLEFWLENAFVYADRAADGKDIMICPTKRYTFIFIWVWRFMSLFGKPLGCFIFFWIGEGLERRVGVVPIKPYKGGAGEIFRKFKVLENFQYF